MGVTEVVVLIAGALIFTVSFLIPGRKEKLSPESKQIAKKEIRDMVLEEMSDIKIQVEDVVEEAVGYAVEKTERSLERLTNEKIMAVNEYSDTVLKEIHKNHEEALFLYDMLNSKHANIKDTVSQVNKSVKEAEEATREVEAVVNNFQKFVPETVVPAKQEEATFEQLELLAGALSDKEQRTSEAGSLEFIDVSDASGQSDSEEKINSNERILELYKQGKTDVEIAQTLGLGVGEVKLVIGLYKNI